MLNVVNNQQVILETHLCPVILCGGFGTRLWPRSRAAKPKPFLPLVDNATLLEASIARCPATDGFAPPVLVSGAAHLGHVKAQLGGVAGARFIVEPSARNTAAAIALAALRLPEDAIMIVCPSDHYIADTAAFQRAAKSGARLAAQGWLVSFGIEASSPETGFGYLQRGEALGDLGFRIVRFIEKPDIIRASQFVADGGYAWNSGIFVFRAGKFLEELELHRPAIAAAARAAVVAGREDGSHFYPGEIEFARIDSESVDYAVMENTDHAAMVPVDMGWSDIGNWDALLEARPCDDRGNAVRGTAELVDCSNVLVETDGPRVSAIGLEDVIIVVDAGEVMVTTRAGAQLVGKLQGAVNQ